MLWGQPKEVLTRQHLPLSQSKHALLYQVYVDWAPIYGLRFGSLKLILDLAMVEVK